MFVFLFFVFFFFFFLTIAQQLWLLLVVHLVPCGLMLKQWHINSGDKPLTMDAILFKFIYFYLFIILGGGAWIYFNIECPCILWKVLYKFKLLLLVELVQNSAVCQTLTGPLPIRLQGQKGHKGCCLLLQHLDSPGNFARILHADLSPVLILFCLLRQLPELS